MPKFVGPNLDINTGPGGDEGGEIHLARPSTNTTISGVVNIDVYQNRVRIFESGGSNRGAYIDLSAASAGVGSNLLAGGGGGGATTLDGLTDVTAPSPATNDFLKWNGTAWVNDSIDLGTDTTGSYVASLVAGTGITLANNSGETATPTVSIDSSTVATLTGTQTLSNKTISNPTILGTVTLPQYINFQGSVNDAYYTTLTVTEPTSFNQITLPNRSGIVITDGDTGTVTSTMIANGTIVNLDISSSAAISHSKLANATPGQVLLGTTTTGVVTATTISGDITIDGAGVATIAANSVALGTDTTGNYVASLVAGNDIILSNNSGESATPTVAVNPQRARNMMTYLMMEVNP